MKLLITLIVLLVLAIVFFITYPILKYKIVKEKYDYFCSKKLEKISSKNNYKLITNLDIFSFNNERIKIDNILFGKKYIYILSNYYFDGDIKGASDNNSWLLEKRHNNGCVYIDNISNELFEKMKDFSTKITANPELIVPIAIVNNETEIKVDGINNNNTFVVRFSSIKKLIKNLEERDIADLDAEQVQIQYENLRNENEERK